MMKVPLLAAAAAAAAAAATGRAAPSQEPRLRLLPEAAGQEEPV